MSAMTLIQHIELDTASAATIEATSISQAYDDLYIVASLRAGTGGGGGLDLYFTFNGSTTGYASRILSGNASSTYVGTGGSSNILLGQFLNASTGDVFASLGIYIPNYTGSNYKTVTCEHVGENNNTTSLQHMIAGLWSNSAAITSIKFDPESTYLLARYSSVTIYGITNGSDGTTTVS